MMKKIFLYITIFITVLFISSCNNKTPKNQTTTKIDRAESFFGDKTAAEWKEYYKDIIDIDRDKNGVPDWQEVEMTIVYASDFYDDEDELNTLFRNALKWAEKYPNITVVRDQRFKKATTNDSDDVLLELLTAASQDGSMPDIYYSPRSAEVYDQDLTLDLTPYLRTDEEARYISSNAFEFMTSFDGQEIWGLPYMSVSLFAVVNRGLLKEKNIPIPSYDWTYEEYETMRAKVGLMTDSGQCIFPGIINFSEIGPHYFDGIPNGWKGFNIKTQRFDFTNAVNYGAWLTEEAAEGDRGWHFWDLETSQREAICGSYGNPWADGFQAVESTWFYMLSTNVQDWILTRGLDIDVYPLPQAPAGGVTATQGFYDTFSLSYKLKDDPVKAQAVFELAKWLTYGEEGTKARWSLIEEDIQKYGYSVDEWIEKGNSPDTFPTVHPSTHLMDYIMGWPVTTNPEVLKNHPLVKGFPEDSPFAVYNFPAFKTEEFQRQLSNPVAYPRQIPAAAKAMEDLNIWDDIKNRIKNEGYSYQTIAPEIDDLLNQRMDDFLRNYTK